MKNYSLLFQLPISSLTHVLLPGHPRDLAVCFEQSVGLNVQRVQSTIGDHSIAGKVAVADKTGSKNNNSKIQNFSKKAKRNHMHPILSPSHLG